MKIKLSYLLILFLSLVHAENYLDAVNVNIYPEYYYEGVMVKMEAIIFSEEEFASISITIPTEADSVFLIRGIPGLDSEVIPLVIVTDEPFKAVEFDISVSQFRLFVFYNPFTSGHDRKLLWPVGSNLKMKGVHLAIQVPVIAEDFVISKEISSEERDQHGILFKKIHLGNILANEVETIEASYFNSSGRTTMENLRAQLEQPQAQSNQPLIENNKPKRHTLLLWEPLVILGVLSIIIGIMYYTSNKNFGTPKGYKNVCNSCGSRLKDNDKFCSNCGEKVS